jgi:hydroxylysine kinase
MFNVSPFASLAEVNRMLSAWEIRASACETARGGVENQTLIIDTIGGAAGALAQPKRVVLRLHRPGSDERVALELAALRHLAALDLPVPRPVPAADGALVVEHQGAAASLLSFVEGLPLDRCVPTPVFARQVGVLLARAGNALAQLPEGRGALAHDITDLATTRDRLASCRKIDGFPWQRVADALEDAVRAVEAWPVLPRQVIHGDVSRGNVIYDDRRFALIDFGDAGAGPRIADAAIALAQLAIAGGRLRPEIWSGLWAGYAAIINPSDDERAAVLPLVKLRYATLIVDHVWRELAGRHHPGHMALVAMGIEGLHALASAPPTLLSLDTGMVKGAA